jgi:hypothetical protein
MFSAFRQFAERTVSSSSSTGRSRIGSNLVSEACGFADDVGEMPFELREDGQLLDQDLGRGADRLLRRDGAVGDDLHDELVEVGALLDAGALDRVAHPRDRRERRVEDDPADRLGRLVAVAAQVARDVAAALLDLDLHVELAARGEMRDLMLGVDDLDIVRRLDVARRDGALALLAQHERDLVAVVQAEDHALQVEHDVDDVFLDAVDRRVLVATTPAIVTVSVGRSRPLTMSSNSAQRVAERVAVAALERPERDLARLPPSGST